MTEQEMPTSPPKASKSPQAAVGSPKSPHASTKSPPASTKSNQPKTDENQPSSPQLPLSPHSPHSPHSPYSAGPTRRSPLSECKTSPRAHPYARPDRPKTSPDRSSQSSHAHASPARVASYGMTSSPETQDEKKNKSASAHTAKPSTPVKPAVMQLMSSSEESEDDSPSKSKEKHKKGKEKAKTPSGRGSGGPPRGGGGGPSANGRGGDNGGSAGSGGRGSAGGSNRDRGSHRQSHNQGGGDSGAGGGSSGSGSSSSSSSRSHGDGGGGGGNGDGVPGEGGSGDTSGNTSGGPGAGGGGRGSGDDPIGGSDSGGGGRGRDGSGGSGGSGPNDPSDPSTSPSSDGRPVPTPGDPEVRYGLKFSLISNQGLSRRQHYGQINYQRLVLLVLLQCTNLDENSIKAFFLHRLNAYFDVPWKKLKRRHERAAHSMAVNKTMWKDKGISPQTISLYPNVRSMAISFHEFCDLCGRGFPDTTQVAYLHLSGQAYNGDTLIPTGPNTPWNIAVGKSCKEALENNHAIQHSIYNTFHQFKKSVVQPLLVRLEQDNQLYDEYGNIDADDLMRRLAWQRGYDKCVGIIERTIDLAERRKIHREYAGREDSAPIQCLPGKRRALDPTMTGGVRRNGEGAQQGTRTTATTGVTETTRTTGTTGAPETTRTTGTGSNETTVPSS